MKRLTIRQHGESGLVSRRREPVAASVMSLVILLGLLACSQPVWADGGFIVTREVLDTEVVEGETQADAALYGYVSSSNQRAVLWLSGDGCWDMFVDPGTIEVSNAAWVLPLPAAPDVNPASSDFIDELDAATLPVLVTENRRIVTRVSYDYDSSESGGCGFGGMASDGYSNRSVEGSDTNDEGSESEGVEPAVQVWDRGRIGSVTYEVVTSDDPQNLQNWLAENDYVLPSGLDGLLEEYVALGYFFFVAKLEREPGSPPHVPVFRFSLCDTDPTYPMKLSTLSVAQDLAFTVWIVLPESSDYYSPTNATLERFGSFYEPQIECGDDGFEYWGECDSPPDFDNLYLERRREIHALRRGLALEMATRLTQDLVNQRVSILGETLSDFPLSEDSSEWTDELFDIVDQGRQVMRLSGTFSMEDMEEDIFFQQGLVSEDTGVYSRMITVHQEVEVAASHEEEPVEEVFGDASCDISSRRWSSGQLLFPLSMLLLAAVLVVRRRRRER